MTKKLVGLVASVALLGSGMALAHDEKSKGQQTQGQQTQQQQPMGDDAFGGAGEQQQQEQMGQMQQQPDLMGPKEISGKVLKSTSKEVHLLTESGVIAVKVNKNTKFQDPTIKRARDLKEGQQVRTSFTVEENSNVAQTIMLDTGTGGSMMDDTGINQDAGGSGMGGQDIGKDKDLGDTGQKGEKSY